MRRFPCVMASSVLVLMAPVLPALGDEIAPARTPWKATDPSGEKVVHWVVEGCAAYPVTVDAAPERAAADIAPQTAVHLTAKREPPIQQ